MSVVRSGRLRTLVQLAPSGPPSIAQRLPSASTTKWSSVLYVRAEKHAPTSRTFAQKPSASSVVRKARGLVKRYWQRIVDRDLP